MRKIGRRGDLRGKGDEGDGVEDGGDKGDKSAGLM
jgi:hypothetical protein